MTFAQYAIKRRLTDGAVGDREREGTWVSETTADSSGWVQLAGRYTEPGEG